MIARLEPKGRVAVRMFCHGLGDCFLIAVKDGAGVKYLAVDCGIVTGNPDGEERMIEATSALRESCGGRLDLLTISHAHWDHVSGFTQAAAEWERFESIGALWLAWTENPNDDLAKELAAGRKKALEVALKALALNKTGRRAAFANLLGFMGLDAKDFGDGKFAVEKIGYTQQAVNAAIELVRRKGGEPVFLNPGNVTPFAEGVDFVVLGPPRDAERIRKEDPSKRNPEVYTLREGLGVTQCLADALDGVTRTGAYPFDDCYRIPEDEFKAGKNPVLTPYKEILEHYEAPLNAWRKIDGDWLTVAENLALNLDSDTNNTSLAFALYLRDEGGVMLFPGDAQVGNWLSWGDRTYPIVGKSGERQTTIDELLTRTAFYKVGHHGSHNATMRQRGLELMKEKQPAAMVPVDADVAHDVKDWKEMPFEPLLARLHDRTGGKLVRLDDDEVPAPFEEGPKARFGRRLYIDWNPEPPR